MFSRQMFHWLLQSILSIIYWKIDIVIDFIDIVINIIEIVIDIIDIAIDIVDIVTDFFPTILSLSKQPFCHLQLRPLKGHLLKMHSTFHGLDPSLAFL
jgi:hypothetical protein